MSETNQFKVPYLQSAQAQKHVTVNEGLARLDALVNLRVESRSLDVPGSLQDGQSFVVPVGASGAWSGQDGKIAIYINGGWEIVEPLEGWTAWVVDETVEIVFKLGSWRFSQSGQSSSANTQLRTLEFDHTITAGATNTMPVLIPAFASVMGVSVRFLQAVTGPVSIRVGVAASLGRYASIDDFAYNSAYIGMANKPQNYFEDTEIVLTADGGNFVDGALRMCVHYIELTPPAAV